MATLPALPKGFVLEGDAGSELPAPPAGFVLEQPAPAAPEQPGIVSNTLRNIGERATDIAGNLLGFMGTAAESGEAALTDLTGINPGVAFGSPAELAARGHDPDIAFGDFALDFTSRLNPEQTDIGLGAADRALSSVDLGYQPTYTWENLKADPGIANLLGFITEQGVGSTPDMAASLLALPAYVASRTQETAEKRVENDQRGAGSQAAINLFMADENTPKEDIARWQQEVADQQTVTAGDLSAAAPSAIASALLERIGAKGVTKLGGVTSGKALAKEAGKAAAKEGGTEFVQENIDYAGESVGTKKGYDPATGLERGIAGMVAGAGVGGAVRGATGAAELAMRPGAVEAAPSADIKESAVAATQSESINSAEIDKSVAPQQAVQETAASTIIGQAAPPEQTVTPPANQNAQVANTDELQTTQDRRQNAELRDEIDSIQDPEILRQRIREVRQQAAESETIARTDELTGIGNRRAYNAAPERPVQAIMDMDNFKDVNDKLGHATGDAAIKEVSDALKAEGLDAYRLGGDEFVVQGDTAADVQAGLERVRARLEGSAIQPGGLRLSYGVAEANGRPRAEVLKEADQRLEADKAARKAAGLRADRKSVAGGIETDAKTDTVGGVDSKFQRSKITDDTGRLATVYHGTGGDGFDVSRVGPGGAYFTDDMEYAAGYTVGKDAPRIEEFELAIENPMEVDQDTWDGILSAVEGQDFTDSEAVAEFIQQAKSQGHDGLIIESLTGTEYVAFEPDQIRRKTTQESTEDTQSQATETSVKADTEALETVADKDGIVLLNAGIPLDQAVKHVHEASKPFIAETAAIAKDIKDAVAGKDSDDRQGVVGRVARSYFYSTHSNVRATANRFKESKALRQIADHFGAMPGEDTGVGQDLLTEAATHATANHNKLGRIVAEAETAKVDLAQVAKMVRNPKSRQGKAGELAGKVAELLKAELQYMREAGVEIGEVREGYLPRVYLRDKMLARKADFISQAERMYAAMGEADPRGKAEAFWFRKVYGDEGRPGQQHAASKESFSKERVLDDSAEKFLGDYLDTNLNSVLFNYFAGSARRAAIARRFGDRWANWPALEAQMKKDGVPPSVVDFVRDSAEVLTGIKDYGFGGNALGALSWIRTFGTLGLLDKAALTSLGELWMPTLRASGDMGVLTNNLKSVISSSVRSILRMDASKRQQALREFAEDIGEVSGNMMGRIMADRWAGGDVEGGRQARAIDAFFRRNLLNQLTEYNIEIALGSAEIFMRRLARDIADGGSTANSSKLLLRELGIPAGKEAEIAKFIKSLNGKLPDPNSKDANHRMLVNAMQRFARQSVMRPDRGTRPKWANHPIGAVIFQLQSFTAAFQKNVINRQARLIGKAVDRKNDLSPQDRLRLALGFAPGFALVFLTQALVGEARDEIFSPDVEKTTGAKAETALARTGFFGQMEPFIQMVSGTRYNRGVLQQLAGPTVGGVGDAIDALFRAVVNNSDDTLTAERGVVRAVYDLLFEPFINLALAPYGGGLVPTLLTVGALPAGRDAAMDAIAGEQEKKKRKPRESVFEMLFDGSDSSDNRGRSGRSGRSGRGGRDD